MSSVELSCLWSETSQAQATHFTVTPSIQYYFWCCKMTWEYSVHWYDSSGCALRSVLPFDSHMSTDLIFLSLYMSRCCAVTGGQLAAWLRIRYPDVIAGAISSSPTFFGAPGLGLVRFKLTCTPVEFIACADVALYCYIA